MGFEIGMTLSPLNFFALFLATKKPANISPHRSKSQALFSSFIEKYRGVAGRRFCHTKTLFPRTKSQECINTKGIARPLDEPIQRILTGKAI